MRGLRNALAPGFKHDQAKLSIISSVQGFDKVPLHTNSLRAASVLALMEAILYRLPTSDFKNILDKEPAFKTSCCMIAAVLTRYDKIKTLLPFALLEPDRMSALLARMAEQTYALDVNIIVQGEKGDYCYIVKNGRVSVLKKSNGA